MFNGLNLFRFRTSTAAVVGTVRFRHKPLELFLSLNIMIPADATPYCSSRGSKSYKFEIGTSTAALWCSSYKDCFDLEINFYLNHTGSFWGRMANTCCSCLNHSKHFTVNILSVKPWVC